MGTAGPDTTTSMRRGRHRREPRRIRSSTRHSLVASSTNLLNGLLNAALLALSARHGQTDEIGAYVAVTAALTLVSIAVAGGAPCSTSAAMRHNAWRYAASGCS